MDWNFESGQPIYAQIVDQMSMRIASGRYQPGERLPSVRDLAVEAGVNPNTMQRALGELERKGLVYSVRTSGRFITEEESILKELHRGLAGQYIEEMFDRLNKLGFSDEEIAELIEKRKSEGGAADGND